MKKVLGDYLFGFDLDEIENVMNGLEVFSEDIMKDEVFLGLIKKCDGEGNFNEDEYNEEE